jgi:hypothetical protein
MKPLLLLIIAILLLIIGCTESKNDLHFKYYEIKVGMTVDEIYHVVGTPDIKLPEVIGETWVWKDDSGINRIAVYVSPQMKWKVPETDMTPKLNIDTGRLVYKQWLDVKAGAS